MSPQSSRGKSALFAAALLSSSATAQNTTNSTGSDGCSARPPLGWDHSVNATGQANVTDTQLVVSLLFGEERNQTASNFAPFTYVYLSAPEGSTDQVCVMQFDSIDNRRQGDGPNGCNGVIPQKCVDLLESAITLPVNLLDLMNNSPGSYGCPNLLLDENTLTEACGTSIGGNFLSSGTSSQARSFCFRSIQCGNIQQHEDYQLTHRLSRSHYQHNKHDLRRHSYRHHPPR
jgi:hypothetical protein